MNSRHGSDQRSATSDMRDLLNEGLSIGFDLIDSVLNMERPTGSARFLQTGLDRIRPKRGCGCEIPPPCWMPEDLGSVTSHPCHGGLASLGIHVINKSMAQRVINLGTGTNGKGVTFSPASLTLGPMESGWVTATVTASDECDQDGEILLWVRGCRDHFVRWRIRPLRRGADCCHEIEVEDAPELVHHWYDHFYCVRPCVHRG